MSAPCSNATPDDEIMALFARDLETADDPGTVIRDYCAGHPSLAEEIRALAAMMQKVDRSRPEPAVQQPTQLGEFRILRRIDHGGQGEIYEAVQERLHRRVAVKIIRRGRISSDARARFLREQQVLAQLHQTHIVPIHMAGEEGSLQYFVMPYIEGAALHNVVRAARLHEPGRQGSKTPTLAELAGMVAGDDKNGGATQDFSPESSGAGSHEPQAARELSPGSGPELPRLKLSPAYFRSVARVMVDAAEALHHAHGAGVLHRDVKPSNIMVDKHEQCWLVDFGLARFENGRMGTGTVTFYDSSVILGAGTLSTTNDITTATFSSSSLALGSRSITASYSGDSNFDSSTSAVLTETVLSAQQQAGLIENQINALVSTGILISGNGNALTTKLDSAITSLNSGNLTAGINQLNAFINQVNAFLKSSKLTSAQAQALIGAVNLASAAAAGGAGAHLLNEASAGTAASADAQPISKSGELVNGMIGVYLEDRAGAITADEQARFNDALSALNATFRPYGVDLLDVGAANAADAIIQVDIAATSPAGNANDGVLGCTIAGQITLVTGWNWYTGTDPGSIGASQYDFETIVTHELGHAIGLGHSGDTGSVMYPNLAPGETRRGVTTTDMAVLEANAETTPEPLLAVPSRGSQVAAPPAPAAPIDARRVFGNAPEPLPANPTEAVNRLATHPIDMARPAVTSPSLAILTAGLKDSLGTSAILGNLFASVANSGVGVWDTKPMTDADQMWLPESRLAGTLAAAEHAAKETNWQILVRADLDALVVAAISAKDIPLSTGSALRAVADELFAVESWANPAPLWTPEGSI